MNRITKTGNGFISLDGTLLNLKAFKKIKKEYLGFQNTDGKNFSISFTPITPSKENIENGVDGTWHVTYYEENDRDKDFEVIQESLQIE